MYLNCLVASSSPPNYVTNSYPISFVVTECSFASIQTSLSYVYNYKENGGSIQTTIPVSNLFNGLTSVCYFKSCSIYLGSSTSFVV